MASAQPDNADIERDGAGAVVEENPGNWTPSRQELIIMLTLSLISLMVSLDATVIITSLSVSVLSKTPQAC
jgi:hypothetical protein